MAYDTVTRQTIADFEAMVKKSVVGQWADVLYTLAPSLRDALDKGSRQHVGCPLHQGKTNKNFRFLPSYPDDGKCICNTCGPFDGWQILREVNLWGWVEAVNAVASVLGIEHPLHKHAVKAPPPIQRPKVVYRDDPELIAKRDLKARNDMNDAWQQALPLHHPEAHIVRRYLQARQLPALPSHIVDLRAHPGMEYWNINEKTDKRELIGKFPVLLAMFRDPNGKPVTLHRVFLAPDGSCKADVPGANKKSMTVPSDQTMVGGAVRIDSQVKSVLAVGEGLETSLAVRAMHGLPTWAVLTAGLMENLEPPPWVKVLIFFTDRDRSHTGQKHAERAVAKFRERGLIATSYEPPFEIPDEKKGVDWADVVEAFTWQQAQKEDFNQQLLASLGKELKGLGMTWRDAF